jgi:hypothetical protein
MKMGERLRLRLTYANVIATLSLFLALGGGAAYAATQLSRNSVGTKQLKKDAVTSAKVKDGSLLAADFKSGQLPAGERGPQGVPGAPGATSAVVRYGEEGKPKEGEGGESYASCRAGEAVTGGGFDFVNSEPENFEYVVLADRPSNENESEGLLVHPAPADGAPASGWVVTMQNDTGDTIFFRAYVVCARP